MVHFENCMVPLIVLTKAHDQIGPNVVRRNVQVLEVDEGRDSQHLERVPGDVDDLQGRDPDVANRADLVQNVACWNRSECLIEQLFTTSHS